MPVRSGFPPFYVDQDVFMSCRQADFELRFGDESCGVVVLLEACRGAAMDGVVINFFGLTLRSYCTSPIKG